MSAVLALAATSGGFTVAEFTAKVHVTTGHTGYTIRQAAYDLRKLRGKELITKPGRTRRYHLSPETAGTIAALLALREHVIAPILAGVRSPRMGRKPATWTKVDRDYEKIRIDMHTLLQDLGIRAAA
jgi:DNA-binding transcriptional ArsR family regulator